MARKASVSLGFPGVRSSPEDEPEKWLGKVKTAKPLLSAEDDELKDYCWEPEAIRRSPGFVCSCPPLPTYDEFHRLDWYSKVKLLWPHLFSSEFADHHFEAWDHAIEQTPGQAAQPLALVLPRGGGKMLDSYTPIPTPDGWAKMGDLKFGDTVFDEMGRPCMVTGIHDQGVQRAFLVRFNDGSEIVAGAEHLWVTWDQKSRAAAHIANVDLNAEDWPVWRTPRGKPKLIDPTCCSHGHPWSHSNGKPYCNPCDRAVRLDPEHRRKGHNVIYHTVGPEIRTTLDLLGSVRTDGARPDLNHSIPVCGPLDLPDIELPIGPYALGVFLGDGCRSSGLITHHIDDEPFIRAGMEASGLKFHRRSLRRESTSVSAYKVDYPGCDMSFRDLLKCEYLWQNKHIPAIYFRASAAQRLALLQGLMDTDGTVAKDKASRVTFTSTLKHLAEGVAELARSLGQKPVISEGRAKLNGKDCGPVWDVAWSATIQVFRLPRKVKILEHGQTTKTQRSRHVHRMIESIVEVEPREMRCITVDSPHHMYLAGESMIPTHNSTTAEAMTAFLGLEGLRKYALYISSSSDAADGHVESIAELLESPLIFRFYREHSDRAVGKYGSSRGWRRNRLQTAGGLVIDAAGLDTKVRGLKRNSVRPDLLVGDDLDESDDSRAAVVRKMGRLTQSIFPAGANDGSSLIVIVQNLVHEDGVVSRIIRHQDGVLMGAKIIGPIPALYDVEYGPDGVPIAGRPSWPAGQPLEVCQRQARLWSPRVFRTESQHDFSEREGALWKKSWLTHDSTIRPEDCLRIVIGYDPAVSDDPNGDEHGIVVVGLLPGRRAVVLDDFSGTYTTNGAALRVRMAEEQYGAEIIFEGNQGKDHVKNTLRSAGCVRLRQVTAKGSKKFRALPVAQMYEVSYLQRMDAIRQGNPPPHPLIVHSRSFNELETQMVGWVPEESTKSPDRVDALVHALQECGVIGNSGLVSVTKRVREKLSNVVSNGIQATDPRQAARAAREEAIRSRREQAKARHASRQGWGARR